MSPSLEYPGGNAQSPDEVGSRVKFAEEFEVKVKVMSPVPNDEFSIDRPPSPASMVSVASSVSSEVSTAPVTKVLATRLSFWNRLSKRDDTKTLDVESPLIAEEEAQPLDTLIHEDMAEPKEVLNKIIETAAPPPASIRQKYAELESKILRQTVKEFSKGEMYFAYDFGMTVPLSQSQ
jgi:phosphatidylinositol 4-phosphatase